MGRPSGTREEWHQLSRERWACLDRFLLSDNMFQKLLEGRREASSAVWTESGVAANVSGACEPAGQAHSDMPAKMPAPRPGPGAQKSHSIAHLLPGKGPVSWDSGREIKTGLPPPPWCFWVFLCLLVGFCCLVLFFGL